MTRLIILLLLISWVYSYYYYHDYYSHLFPDHIHTSYLTTYTSCLTISTPPSWPSLHFLLDHLILLLGYVYLFHYHIYSMIMYHPTMTMLIPSMSMNHTIHDHESSPQWSCIIPSRIMFIPSLSMNHPIDDHDHSHSMIWNHSLNDHESSPQWPWIILLINVLLIHDHIPSMTMIIPQWAWIIPSMTMNHPLNEYIHLYHWPCPSPSTSPQGRYWTAYTTSIHSIHYTLNNIYYRTYYSCTLYMANYIVHIVQYTV